MLAHSQKTYEVVRVFVLYFMGSPNLYVFPHILIYLPHTYQKRLNKHVCYTSISKEKRKKKLLFANKLPKC